jgi:hypothetical protein
MHRLMFALVALSVGGSQLCAAEPPVTAARETTALIWEHTRVEQQAKLGQERTEAIFPFRNSGITPVTITAIESSCGCTTAQLPKNTYAPGEKGEVRAVFEFGPRIGPQKKVLTVMTDDAAVATQLMLQVDIPVVFAIDQRVVLWSLGETAAIKTVVVHTATIGVVMGKLTYDQGVVEATLAPLADGRGYLLNVRPLSTAEPQRQTVMVNALVDGRPQALPVHLFVR